MKPTNVGQMKESTKKTNSNQKNKDQIGYKKIT